MFILRHIAFLVNCVSSVALIYFNRFLLTSCQYSQVGILAALHAGVTVLATCYRCEENAKVNVSRRDLVLFLLCSNVAVISMNLSLMLNNVGAYQIFKLLMIPSCGFLDFFVHSTIPSLHSTAAMCIVMIGVAVATVFDASLSRSGIAAASIGVISSSGHNVGCSYISRAYNIDATTFVRQTMPLQFFSLVIIGPVYDMFYSGLPFSSWYAEFCTTTCTLVLSATCILAAVVNISLVACIRQYDATGSQVLGHSKTICVLVIGWVLYRIHSGAHLLRQYVGAVIIVVGITLYSKSMPSS